MLFGKRKRIESEKSKALNIAGSRIGFDVIQVLAEDRSFRRYLELKQPVLNREIEANVAIINGLAEMKPKESFLKRLINRCRVFHGKGIEVAETE